MGSRGNISPQLHMALFYFFPTDKLISSNIRKKPTFVPQIQFCQVGKVHPFTHSITLSPVTICLHNFWLFCPRPSAFVPGIPVSILLHSGKFPKTDSALHSSPCEHYNSKELLLCCFCAALCPQALAPVPLSCFICQINLCAFAPGHGFLCVGDAAQKQSCSGHYL